MKHLIHLPIIIVFISFLIFLPKGVIGQADSSKVYEGYYKTSFENSSFYEKNDDKIIRRSWLEFDKSIHLTDSLKVVLRQSAAKNGIYMKVVGVLKTNGSFGHLGGSTSEITVFKILTIDSTDTLEDFFIKNK